MNPLSIISKQISGAILALLLLFTISNAQTNPDDIYWQDGFQQPGVNGTVGAMIEFEGKVVVGGSFTTAGGITVNHVATWDGEQWAAMGEGLDINVTSLIVYNGMLIACGGKIFPVGQYTGIVAAWNGSTWTQLGGDFNEYVFTLTIFENKLVAGGRFTGVDTAHTSCIAVWDGAEWSRLGSGVGGSLTPFGPIGPIPPAVGKLTVFQSKLIATGQFRFAGADTVRGAAEWDGISWSRIDNDTSYAGYAFASVTDAIVYNDQLIIARYGLLSGLSTTYLLTWDGVNWGEFTFGTDVIVQGSISGFSIVDGKLFVAGNFSINDSPGHFFRKIMTWDGSVWEQLEKATMIRDTPSKVVHFDNKLIIGGNFYRVDDFNCQNIISLDNDTWRMLGDGLDYYPNASVVYDDKLVLGGWFTTAGGMRVANVVAWDGEAWSAFGNGVNGSLNAMTVYHNELVAAGSSFELDSIQTRGPVVWNGTNWRPITTHPIDEEILALTVHDDKLIAGGEFRTIDSVPVEGLAAWDGNVWSTFGNDAAVDRRKVLAMISDGDRLFLGGSFVTYVPIIQQYANTNLQILDNGNWLATGKDIPEVTAFTLFNGNPVTSGARWGSMWGPIDWPVTQFDGWSVTQFGSYVNGSVLALAEYDGKLVAGGGFDSIGGVAANNIAIWNGNSWAPLGSGVNAAVRTLTTYHDMLCVGGEFTNAGGKPSTFFAIWNKQTPTGTGDDPHVELPDGYQLSQNYPNPFNPSTQIEYELPSKSQVTVTVYNLLGQKVRSLVNEIQSSGLHVVEWDGRDDDGKRTATGMYMYRIEAGDFKQTKKMLLIK